MQIREAWRTEKNDEKGAGKNKQRLGFKEIKKTERRRSEGENGMRMPIKVGNWSPLLLSILLVPIFPLWCCEIRRASELSR